MTDQPAAAKPMENGAFIVLPYKVKIDFAAQPDAIWEIIWRGKTDAHATLDGRMKPGSGLEWYGSSCQTGLELIRRVESGIIKGFKKIRGYFSLQ